VEGKIAELDTQGHTQPEIARVLQVSLGTVNSELSILRQQAKDNIRKFINEKLPHEYQRCLTGLTAILREHGLHHNDQKIKGKTYRRYHWQKNAIP
jgi:hypothetical protein